MQVHRYNENTAMCFIAALSCAALLYCPVSAQASDCLSTWTDNNPKNLISNAGFESDFSGWTKSADPAGVTTSIDDTVAFRGSKSLKVVFDGSSAAQNYFHLSQAFNVRAGEVYQFSAAFKTDGVVATQGGVEDRNSIRITLVDADAGWEALSGMTRGLYGTQGWTRFQSTITIPPGTTRIRVQIRRLVGSQSGPSFGTGWWDAVQLIPVPVVASIERRGGEIILSGKGFGDSTGADAALHCVLNNGVCLNATNILFWNDSKIVIDDSANTRGDGPFRVRSGGVASNPDDLAAPLVLSSSTMELIIARPLAGGGITHLTHLASGRAYLDQSGFVPPLYALTTKRDPFQASKRVRSALEAVTLNTSLSTVDGVQKLSIVAEHCDGITVEAIIEMPVAAGGPRFSAEVLNTGTEAVQSLRYPQLSVKLSLGETSTDDTIVVPFFEGYLVRDPALNAPKTMDSDMRHPGRLSMQMMAYYDSEEPDAGLYFATNDSTGHFKRMGFERIETSPSAEALFFSFLHSTAESSGNGLRMPYDVIVDSFTGDWYDAADRYKAWAIQQPWASVLLADRVDVPEWLYDIRAMIDCYSCRPEPSDPQSYAAIVNAYQSLLGETRILLYPGGGWGLREGAICPAGPTGARLSWSGVDKFSENTVYDAAEAGNLPHPVLAEAIAALAADNADVLLFHEGMTWDQYFYELSIEADNPFAECQRLDEGGVIPSELVCYDDRTDFYTYAANHVVRLEWGQPKNSTTWAYDKTAACRLTSTMCIGSDDNNVMDKVIYNNIERGIDHGARLMSLDAIVAGAISGCWDETHGHPIGEGQWIHQRFSSVLNDVKNIVAARSLVGEFGLAIENAQEMYLQDLQFQYQRSSDLRPSGNMKIPLFEYVYHEFYLGVERGQSLAVKNGKFPRWALAFDFVQGNLQGTMISSDPTTVPDPNLIAYYKRMLALRRPEMMHGVRKRPPPFSGMPAESTVTFKKNTYIVEPVVTSVLQTSVDSVSYFLVNTALDGTTDQSIEFNAIQYGLPNDTVDLFIRKNGETLSTVRAVRLPYAVSVSLNAGDAVEVRTENWDYDADGLSNVDEEALGSDPRNADTDGDGLSDAEEVLNGTDVLVPEKKINNPRAQGCDCAGTSTSSLQTTLLLLLALFLRRPRRLKQRGLEARCHIFAQMVLGDFPPGKGQLAVMRQSSAGPHQTFERP